MPNFVTDPDNNKKVVMGGYSVNDKSMKASQQLHCTMSAPPSYVIVADGDGSNDSIGFFFGSSASFAEKAVIEGNSSVAASVLTGSANYVSFGAGITTGTK